MKYIYKHGNQYWYQRAIPKKFTEIIGKKSIKVSLRTNKVSTALVRAKLQSSEHKKMFKKIENRKFSLKFLKKIEVSKYNLEFKSDSYDLVSSTLLNKKEICDLIAKKEGQSLENFLFENLPKQRSISELLDKYLKLKNLSTKSRQYSSITNSIKYLISICGDKPLEDFNRLDANNFRNFFINKKRVPTGKRYQSNLYNFFNLLSDHLEIEKKNPFQNIEWPLILKSQKNKILSDEEIGYISKIIDQEVSLFTLSVGVMVNTGCSLSEIVGLSKSDINLNQYAPYIIIRDNNLRKIYNIYKKRTIPLVGISLNSMQVLLRSSTSEFPFQDFIEKGFELKKIENKINFKLKKLIKKKLIILLGLH